MATFSKRTKLVLYDKDRRPCTAFLVRHFRDVTNQDSGEISEAIPVAQQCRLEDETILFFVDEDTFRNSETGELLYRKKPD